MNTKKKSIIFFIIIFFLFIGFGIFLQYNGNSSTKFDYNLLKYVRDNLNPSMFFLIITKIGNVESYFYIFIPVVLVLLYKKEYNTAITIIISILIATLFMVVFKNIFQRIRPVEFFAVNQGGFSYPSGHSIVSSSVYLTLFHIARIRKFNILFQIFLVFLPITIGFSRLVLGVHWPTDVIFGLLLGFSFSLINIEIYKKLKGNNG